MTGVQTCALPICYHKLASGMRVEVVKPQPEAGQTKDNAVALNVRLIPIEDMYN